MTITLCILGWIAGAIGTAWLERWRRGSWVGQDEPFLALLFLILWPVHFLECLFP